MIVSKFSKLHLKRLSLLLSVFPVTANAMLKLRENLTSSVVQRSIARTNSHGFGKFKPMINVASFSTKNSKFNANDSKVHKWIVTGVLGSLGFSTIAMNQNAQNKIQFNELIQELHNDEIINQEIKTSYNPKDSMINVFSDAVLLDVTSAALLDVANGLPNFIGFERAVLHCGENDIIKIPSADELQNRLSSIGLDHFAEKTSLIARLAGQEKAALGVALVIEQSFGDYFEYLEQGMPKKQLVMARTTTLMLKPLLYETLLKNFPEALDELKKIGLV